MGEIKDLYDSNKTLKIIFHAILLLVIIFFVIVIVKTIMGQHIKLFGIELNIEETKSSTEQIKKDTAILNPKPLEPILINKPTDKKLPITKPERPTVIKEKDIPKDTLPKIQTTSSGVGNHVISGNGNNVGVNGDVEINNGIKQRKLTPERLADILSKIKDTSSTIDYRFPANDKEAENYANEIFNTLYKKGYKRFKSTLYHSGIPRFDVLYYGYIKENIRYKDSVFAITIYPSSNTNH